MIGVISKAHQWDVVEEFFELFKTPWEHYRPGRVYDALIAAGDEAPEAGAKLVLVYSSAANSMDAQLGIAGRRLGKGAVLRARKTAVPIYGKLLTLDPGVNGAACLDADSGSAGVRVERPGSVVIRLGYDLFDEVRSLLSAGQPLEYAHIPTLDIHIQMLREWMLEAGLSFLEIPPVPAGRSFIVCLTHDIDFIGIRQHLLDHSMWGFLFRATAGAIRNFMRGRLSLTRLLRSWRAVASLPFVYLGWAKDFWEPFEWYMEVEKGLPATYFLIPFKRRAGEKVPGRRASRRATAYDVADLPRWTAALQSEGCELGVHGLDAWHSVEKGRAESARLAAVTRRPAPGIRMHWLLRDERTPAVLEQAGYLYDSTFGYNETVGYRAGTGQVFRPPAAKMLLEVPLHIQDGALFYPQRLNLSEIEAEKRCESLLDNARKFGGVLTFLWHDRSHAPERFWGDFYIALVRRLKTMNVWFGTAAQAAGWFRQRRAVRFEAVETSGVWRTRLCYEGEEIRPPLRVRVYGGTPRGNADFVDTAWEGNAGGRELLSDIASCQPLA